MALNLLHLQTFRHLVEAKSFTRTASQLNMTQPGVSQHLRALELYFGDKLLTGVGKKFELTRKGKMVYDYAVKLFREHEDFKLGLQGDDPKAGLCRMSSPGSIGIGLYTELLKINSAHPDLAIQFHYAPNRTIENELETDKLDMGFMSDVPRSNALDKDILTQERLLIITPKKKAPRNIKELLEIGLITHPDAPDMLNKVFLKNFPREYQGVEKIRVRGGSNQIGRILEPVSLGLGFTVLPHYAYEAFPDKKGLSLFDHPHEIVNNIYVVRKRFRELPARFDFIHEKLQKSLFRGR